MIVSYVKDYIENERRENKLWEKSLKASGCSQEEIRVYMQKIEDKEIALNWYEKIVRGSFNEYGVDYDAISKQFPNVLDRFKAIGKELTHRTLYKALCSQIHNDAEDFINDFWHQITYFDSGMGLVSMSHIQNFQELENKFFSHVMVYNSALFFLESCVMYIARFEAEGGQTLFQIFEEIGALTLQLETEKSELLKTFQKGGFS